MAEGRSLKRTNTLIIDGLLLKRTSSEIEKLCEELVLQDGKGPAKDLKTGSLKRAIIRYTRNAAARGPTFQQEIAPRNYLSIVIAPNKKKMALPATMEPPPPSTWTKFIDKTIILSIYCIVFFILVWIFIEKLFL